MPNCIKRMQNRSNPCKNVMNVCNIPRIICKTGLFDLRGFEDGLSAPAFFCEIFVYECIFIY